jgi:predicted phosphodiesterase
MRIGLISDVHANLHALDRVLVELRGERVDRILCAGDIVGYGPYPNETIDRLADSNIAAVAGNHDLIAAGLLGEDGCTPVARDSLRWTKNVLTGDSLNYLRSLPSSIGEAGVLVTHGSFEDPWRYVKDTASADEQLARASEAGAFILILGHTHKQWLYAPQSGSLRPARDGDHFVVTRHVTTLLNPGSVGHSRSPHAQAAFAVLDLEGMHVRFRLVDYDAEACRRALVDRGLSPRLCHSPPTMWRRARGRVKRVADRIVPEKQQRP